MNHADAGTPEPAGVVASVQLLRLTNCHLDR